MALIAWLHHFSDQDGLFLCEKSCIDYCFGSMVINSEIPIVRRLSYKYKPSINIENINIENEE